MGTDADNREILKSRLAKGEISVKEYEELQKILNEHLVPATERTAIPTDACNEIFEEIQEILDKHLVPVMERVAIPTDTYYWDILRIINSQLDSATERAMIPTDTFEFTGIKKILLYILVVYSAMWILIMLVLGYWGILSSNPSLNEIAGDFSKYIFNVDGTILHYIFGDTLYNGLFYNLMKKLIIVDYALPLLIFYFCFKMREFKKNKTIKQYNKLISIAAYIVIIQFIEVIYISKDVIDNILIFCPFALTYFVFWKVANTPKIE